MKLFISLAFIVLFVASPLRAQNILYTATQEQTLSSEQCADLIKIVWEEVKQTSDEYSNQLHTKNEFETTSDYETRVQNANDASITRVRKFSNSHKLDSRLFAVWIKADLVKYNADEKIYTIKSSTKISLPPSSESVLTLMPPNPYLIIKEFVSSGYKYALMQLNTNPEFIWHVEKEMAQKTKFSEQQLYFKVWFKLDITQPKTTDEFKFVIVPTKITLLNKDDNTNYWSEIISQ